MSGKTRTSACGCCPSAHNRPGRRPGRSILGPGVVAVATDLLVHGWDLSRAIGADERLDPELVDACAAWFATVARSYRAGGAVGPRPATPPDADAQTLLLADFGRTAAG